MDDFPLIRDAGEKPRSNRTGVHVDDFYAYMPMHSYIYAPTRELWPASSVNARVLPPAKGIKANLWLDQHRPVEQMTWAPGAPIIKIEPISGADNDRSIVRTNHNPTN